MNGDAPLSGLMFFTLIAGVVVGGGMLLWFLRSRQNREIAAVALEGDGRSRHGEPSGAGAELGGLFGMALVAMALLTVGYRSHMGGSVVTPTAVNQPNNQLATDRVNPDTPKPYQPANPAPDTRAAPTSSSTGR